MLAEPPLVDCEKTKGMGDMVDFNFQVNIDLIVQSGRMWRPRSKGRFQKELWKDSV